MFYLKEISVSEHDIERARKLLGSASQVFVIHGGSIEVLFSDEAGRIGV